MCGSDSQRQEEKLQPLKQVELKIAKHLGENERKKQLKGTYEWPCPIDSYQYTQVGKHCPESDCSISCQLPSNAIQHIYEFSEDVKQLEQPGRVRGSGRMSNPFQWFSKSFHQGSYCPSFQMKEEVPTVRKTKCIRNYNADNHYYFYILGMDLPCGVGKEAMKQARADKTMGVC